MGGFFQGLFFRGSKIRLLMRILNDELAFCAVKLQESRPDSPVLPANFLQKLNHHAHSGEGHGLGGGGHGAACC